MDWSSNAAERGVKPAKRHQAVSGYWQTDQTLNRWCLIQSYLTSARNHGLTILDAITRAQVGKPWLPGRSQRNHVHHSRQPVNGLHLRWSVHAEAVAAFHHGLDVGGAAEGGSEAGHGHLHGVFVGAAGQLAQQGRPGQHPAR